MILHFNVTGDSRKAMVQAIEKELGCKARYLRVPTCAYEIGNYTVGKNGELEFDNEENLETSSGVVDACVLATGVSPEEWDSQGTEAVEADCEADTGADEPDYEGIRISVPREGFTDAAIENLKKLVESKAALFKKAFLTEELPIVITDETIAFPWFASEDADAAVSYTKFISAICDMAKNQKRITAKAKENENEKYAFRCFLLRLGFIGDDFKKDRKILLSNLNGSAAFKSGAKKGGEQ